MTHVIIDDKVVLSGCLILNEDYELLLLYRTTHKKYELPGGKLELNECKDPENPTIEELRKAAEREAYEELGNEIKVISMKYFEKIEFDIPDGRKGTGYNFITKITGNPKINEPDKFSEIRYVKLNDLEKYDIAPNLRLLLPKLKAIET